MDEGPDGSAVQPTDNGIAPKPDIFRAASHTNPHIIPASCPVNLNPAAIRAARSITLCKCLKQIFWTQSQIGFHKAHPFCNMLLTVQTPILDTAGTLPHPLGLGEE